MAPALLVAIVLAADVYAQQRPQPPIDRLRILAAADSADALVDAVRAHPDDARELVRVLMVQASAVSAPNSDSTVARARRVSSAVARAWADSFLVIQVERFARMTPTERRAKIAADSLRWRGNTALARSGVAAALALWREGLRRSTTIADSAGMAASIGNIGAGYYRAEELDSAERYLTRARTIADAIGDRRTALNALGTLGGVARDRGELRRAGELYASALALRTRVGDQRGAAADHNNLGMLAADLGDLDAASAHYEEALALATRHALPDAEAIALMNLGNVASVRGEYVEAARRYEAALAIYRASRSEADAAFVLHNLGLLALRRGHYRTARARLEEALAIFARAGTVTDRVLVRSDLSSVAAAMGDLREAMTQLDRAERLLTTAGEDPDLAAGLALARADVSAQLNTLPDAERQYARAEALYRRAGDRAGEADAQQGHAVLLAERGQYAQALGLLRAAVRTQAASIDRRPVALTQLMIGHVLHRQDDLVAARRVLQGAVDSLAALRDAAGEAAALGALGDVELDAGAPLVAESLYRRGLARLGERSALTSSWQLRAGLGYALRRRGALVAAATELRAAIADIERMAATLPLEERRSTFLADKWDAYGELAMTERALGDAGAAFATSERMRARQMLDLMARGRVAPAPASDSTLVERAQDAQRRVGELTRTLEREEGEAATLRGPDRGAAPSGITREALARAQQDYEALMLALRENETAYGQIARGEHVSWRDVARRLAPDEALLEYLVLDSTAVAFVVTRDSVRVVDLDIGRRALGSLVEFARDMMVRPQPGAAAPPTKGWREPLRQLHRYLVAPVEETGALDGVRRLIIVPNVELHYLPFAALVRDARGRAAGEFLIERYEIGYAPSASVWVRLGSRRASPASGILALAPRIEALPGSREEVEAIRQLYGSEATVLTGGAASERAFRGAVGRHGIVHLATYGVLNKHNPLFSFVSLHPGTGEDGRLEVHEVFSLALNARLLVLSACQTALGSGAIADVPAGDDWIGLARAFLGAGAANVIATLWPVEDRSTARLMANLHRSLRAGEPEISAVASAQRAALRNSATADPFYWAGIVLVGGR